MARNPTYKDFKYTFSAVLTKLLRRAHLQHTCKTTPSYSVPPHPFISNGVPTSLAV